MSLSTQAKVLRALQEQEVQRVGGTKTIKVDVRVIAASNKVLEDEIKAGRFREDLYYRLNVIPFHVPPLRERKEDIPLLADYFIRDYSVEYGKRPKVVQPGGHEAVHGLRVAGQRARDEEHDRAARHNGARRRDSRGAPAAAHQAGSATRTRRWRR